jgi:hypothetical protein
VAKLTDIVEEEIPPEAVEALKGHLHMYLETLGKRPLTPRTLLDLERTAKLAREMLALAKGGKAGAGPASYAAMQQSGVVMGNVGYDVDEGTVLPFGTVPSTASETFGATMVREIISAVTDLSKQKETAPPVAPIAVPFLGGLGSIELVNAIAVAREKKLVDVEQMLLQQLNKQTDVHFGLPPASPCVECGPDGHPHQCPDGSGQSFQEKKL